MKRNLCFFCWCMVCLCLALSCGKPSIPWPGGHHGSSCDSGGTQLSGDISGVVVLYDTLGHVLPRAGGVRVQIDSTALETLTDSTGHYVFKNVKAGRYSFRFSKAGYGTYRLLRLQHAGTPATSLPQADVGAIYYGPPATPDSYVIGLNGPTNPDPGLLWEIYVTYPTAAEAQGIIFFGAHAPLTATNYRVLQRFSTTTYNDVDDNRYSFDTPQWSASLIQGDSVLKKSDSLYVSFAWDNPHLITYTDENGQVIHPCVSPLDTTARIARLNPYLPNPYSQSRRGL